MDYFILTFPRCGSHYLQQLIFQKLNVFIEKSHNPTHAKNKKIISIIRKPEDSFRSMILAEYHFSGNEVGIPISRYTKTYQYLIENADILVDYNDLVSSPDKVVEFIAKKLKVPVKPVQYKDNLIDNPKIKYLVRSKTADVYHRINLDKYDLSEANKFYIKAKQICIKL